MNPRILTRNCTIKKPTLASVANLGGQNVTGETTVGTYKCWLNVYTNTRSFRGEQSQVEATHQVMLPVEANVPDLTNDCVVIMDSGERLTVTGVNKMYRKFGLHHIELLATLNDAA